MNTIFINSKNSKTSDPNRLLLNVTDKIDLSRKDKFIALSNISIYYAWKNIKKSYRRTMDSKKQLQHGMKNLNYLMDHILYQTFKIILNVHLLSMEKYKKVIQENNGFKIPAPTWNEEFKLPDGSYSILDIQDLFEYILKVHGKKTVNHIE